MVDPELDKIFDHLENGPLSSHATYIGQLCITWSWLETSIDVLLGTLLFPLPHQEAATVIYNMNFREKLETNLTLGYQKRPNEQWHSDLSKIINEINHSLRPERNRMVHDTWFGGSPDAIRISSHAKLVNTQSRQKTLSFSKTEEISKSKVMVLVVKIMHACAEVSRISSAHPNFPILLDTLSDKGE